MFKSFDEAINLIVILFICIMCLSGGVTLGKYAALVDYGMSEEMVKEAQSLCEGECVPSLIYLPVSQ